MDKADLDRLVEKLRKRLLDGPIEIRPIPDKRIGFGDLPDMPIDIDTTQLQPSKYNRLS